MKSIVTWLAALLLATQSFAQPASAPDPINYNSECGAPATGKRSGSAELVKLTADEAKGLQVGPDGFWRWCAAPALTLDTACGAPAVGIDESGATVSATLPQRRVNRKGHWEACDKPCLPSNGPVWRSWAVGNASCTSYLSHASATAEALARDHAIPHGESAGWQQALGPMRGYIIEQCVNGVRTEVSRACAPATACDSKISHVEREGKMFEYDARPSPIPNGQTIELVAADGSTWPAACIAGSWDVPTSKPRPATVRTPKAPPVCNYRVSSTWLDGKMRLMAYTGPTVPIGSVVTAREIGGNHTLPMVCTITALVKEVPAHGGFEEWREAYEQYIRTK